MSSLLTIHTQNPASKVANAGHSFLLLEIHHSEDAVVRTPGHEVISPKILNTRKVGCLAVRLNIGYNLSTSIVQNLKLVLGSPASNCYFTTLLVNVNT